jgi:hypothetical protein
VRQRPPPRTARQQQRWPQGKRYCWKALIHVPSRGTRTSHQSQRAKGPSAGGTDGLVGGSNHRCGGKPHQRRPPLQHRLRTTRPSPRWRTDSCTLARQQQFTFPRMAGGRLLCRAGGCPSPPNAGGRSGSPAQAKVGPTSDGSRTRNRRPPNRPSCRINSLAGQATPPAGEAGAVSSPS